MIFSNFKFGQVFMFEKIEEVNSKDNFFAIEDFQCACLGSRTSTSLNSFSSEHEGGGKDE
jgi:hypothetical protein